MTKYTHVPHTSKVLFKLAHPTAHLGQDMLATTQYKSGFSSLEGLLISGVETGDGVVGVFNLKISLIVPYDFPSN